jgi:hypothetical protein
MEILGVDGNPKTVQTRTAADLSHNELILYYELLDNWIKLDVGVSAKYLMATTRYKFKPWFKVVKKSMNVSLYSMQKVSSNYPLPVYPLMAAFKHSV